VAFSYLHFKAKLGFGNRGGNKSSVKVLLYSSPHFGDCRLKTKLVCSGCHLWLCWHWYFHFFWFGIQAHCELHQIVVAIHGACVYIVDGANRCFPNLDKVTWHLRFNLL